MTERTDLADHLRLALDLYDFGERVMRENLRRRHPEAGDREIEALLVAWLRDRPMDAPGRIRAPHVNRVDAVLRRLASAGEGKRHLRLL